MFRSRIRLDFPPNILDVYFKNIFTGDIIIRSTHSIVNDFIKKTKQGEKFLKDTPIKQFILQSEIQNEDVIENSIIFLRINDSEMDQGSETLWGYIPHSNFRWIGENWNLYVNNIDDGIAVLNAMIRLFIFPGLVCFDIDDIRSLFFKKAAFAVKGRQNSYKELKILSTRVDKKYGEITRIGILYPTPDKNINYQALIEALRSKHSIPKWIDLFFATYNAGSAEPNTIIIAG